jgi:phosphoribosyl-AMP cyclohydrolase
MRCPNDQTHQIRKLASPPYLNTMHGLMFDVTFTCDTCYWKKKKIYTLRAEEFYARDEQSAEKTIPPSIEAGLCHANFISTLVERDCASVIKEEREENCEFMPVFQPALNHDGTRAPDLITAVLQDFANKNVLFAATMDEWALQKTLATGRVHLYSRTTKNVRRKGETSGDELSVMDIYVNCNQDCLLIQVERLGKNGGCCHTKNKQGQNRSACFYRVVGKIVGKTTNYVLSFLK